MPMIIETVFLNLLFMIPGFFLIELFDIDVKGKYLLTPYLSFGYFNFFIWVILSTIPGLIMIKFLSIKQNYGRNKA